MRPLLTRLMTALLFCAALLVIHISPAYADGDEYFNNGDPNCPWVEYGPWISHDTCDNCVTYHEWCLDQCADVYYYQDFPGCTVNNPFDADSCTNFCDNSQRECLKDGPCET
jgi:hypothetical protein